MPVFALPSHAIRNGRVASRLIAASQAKATGLASGYAQELKS